MRNRTFEPTYKRIQRAVKRNTNKVISYTQARDILFSAIGEPETYGKK